MRRKDREMNDEFAYGVFDRMAYAVIAMTDDGGRPYCIPVSPVRIGSALYFHCAEDGLKLKCLRKREDVCVCAVSRAEAARNMLTVWYESAVARGRAYEVTDAFEKREALLKICSKYCPVYPDDIGNAIDRQFSETVVVRIDIDEITGKKNG